MTKRSGSSAVLKDMVELPGGTFRMGSDRFSPEERPVREVTVDGAEFRRFVKDTGHGTWAEQAPQCEDSPGADPEDLVPGSLVFRKTDGPVSVFAASSERARGVDTAGS